MMNLFILVMFFLFQSNLNSFAHPIGEKMGFEFFGFSGRSEMNEISFDDLSGFEHSWKLVTVRYREDTGELRFTYANNKAFRVISDGLTYYPDGAIFAKTSFLLRSDDLFRSSLVPSVRKRFQFMVRDRERYKDTDGWGYAVFNADGKTILGDPKTNSSACAACHRLASERGFVFSRYMLRTSSGKQVAPLEPYRTNALVFKRARRVDVLPELARGFLGAKDRLVFLIDGEIRKNIFEGTLDEVMPELIQKTRKEGAPAALVSSRKDIFAMAYINRRHPKCPLGEYDIRTVRTVISIHAASETILKVNSTCVER